MTASSAYLIYSLSKSHDSGMSWWTALLIFSAAFISAKLIRLFFCTRFLIDLFEVVRDYLVIKFTKDPFKELENYVNKLHKKRAQLNDVITKLDGIPHESAGRLKNSLTEIRDEMDYGINDIDSFINSAKKFK